MKQSPRKGSLCMYLLANHRNALALACKRKLVKDNMLSILKDADKSGKAHRPFYLTSGPLLITGPRCSRLCWSVKDTLIA